MNNLEVGFRIFIKASVLLAGLLDQTIIKQGDYGHYIVSFKT
jgi:hypothetical protein